MDGKEGSTAADAGGWNDCLHGPTSHLEIEFVEM